MNQRFLRPSLLAASVASIFGLSAGVAYGSGFQLQEQSASGLGVAYSGMAAAVQDASTAFWNPAGMALLPGINVAGALHYIIPSTKFENSGSTYGNPPFSYGNGGQGGESAFVPALYGTWMINPQWTVGLAVNAPFGLATEWDTPWVGQFHAIRSEIKTLNINPTVAFKVNNSLALGAGISYQRLEAELSNSVPGFAGSLPAALANSVTGTVQGEDWSWGWNIGAMFDFQQGTRVGLTYRSAIKYTIEGDLSYSGRTLPGVPAGQNVTADVELPYTFSIGLSHQFNPKLRMLLDYTYTGWDSIKTLDIKSEATGATLTSTELEFKNSYRIGVGAEYQLNQPWLLRAGVAYDTTPVQDQYRTPRLPDENRTWLAIGARYQPAPNWSIDMGYTYIWVSDASSNLRPTGAEAVRGTLIGSYSSDIQILGVQGNFRF